MQYLSEGEREEPSAGSSARRARGRAEGTPLAWLRMEPDGTGPPCGSTTWPGGEDRLLARAGYHGTPVELS